MGDYRNEFESALAQLEALRGENASLRAQLRTQFHTSEATPSLVESAPTEPPPAPPSGKRKVLVYVVGSILATVVTMALRGSPRPEVQLYVPEAQLSIPDTPTVPAEREDGPLPMPPTSVRLPERPNPPEGPQEDIEEQGLALQPVALQPISELHAVVWRNTSRGLYVLVTNPDAECTVGGVQFRTPRPVYLEPGDFTVRCEAGRTRQRWRVRIAAGQVTFDLDHRIGR